MTSRLQQPSPLHVMLARGTEWSLRCSCIHRLLFHLACCNSMYVRWCLTWCLTVCDTCGDLLVCCVAQGVRGLGSLPPAPATEGGAEQPVWRALQQAAVIVRVCGYGRISRAELGHMGWCNLPTFATRVDPCVALWGFPRPAAGKGVTPVVLRGSHVCLCVWTMYMYGHTAVWV